MEQERSTPNTLYYRTPTDMQAQGCFEKPVNGVRKKEKNNEGQGKEPMLRKERKGMKDKSDVR